MNGHRHGLALVTLLSAIASILIFPTGCARHGVTQNIGAGSGRDVLIPGLPVTLLSDKWAVNADETAYAVGGESGVVVELSLPSCQYRSMWNLGELVYAIFSDGDRYVAVVPSGIYSLRGAEKKRIGAIPEGDKLRLPPELSGARRSLPLSCRNGRILWHAYGGLKKQTVVFSTDCEGRDPRGFEIEELRLRVAPGAEWVMARSPSTQQEWLVTPDGLIETEKGGTIAALGHNSVALLHDVYRWEYSSADRKFTRVDGAFWAPSEIRPYDFLDTFVSKKGYFIDGSSAVWSTIKDLPQPQESLRFSSCDGESLFVKDTRERNFQRADFASGRVSVIASEGYPLYCDSQIRVTCDDKGLVVVNGKEVRGPLPAADGYWVRRAGRILYLQGKHSLLIDLDNLASEIVKSQWMVGNDRVLLVKMELEEGKSSGFDGQWVAVNPACPSQRLTVEGGLYVSHPVPPGPLLFDKHRKMGPVGQWLDDILVLDDRIVGFRMNMNMSLVDEAFEFDVDFAAKRAVLRKIPADTLFPLAGGLSLNIWARNQEILGRRGQAIGLPDIFRKGSGLLEDGRASEFNTMLIAYKGSQYIRCGCNFVRIGE
ncbi:MAG: hypothetical protein WC712_03885 [Candidatus Brocadiia bacterium]